MSVVIVKTRLYSVYGVAGDNSTAQQQEKLPNAVQNRIEAEAKVNSSPSQEQVFARTLTFGDTEIIVDFIVLKMDRSAFIWCGVRQGPPRLDSLAMALCLDKSKPPVATGVLGGTTIAVNEDEASAVRIAKKTGLVAVHFSSNLGLDTDHTLRMFAEREILAALK